jgi:hypothetical protein
VLSDLFGARSKKCEPVGGREGCGIDAKRVRAIPRLDKRVRGQMTQGRMDPFEMRQQVHNFCRHAKAIFRCAHDGLWGCWGWPMTKFLTGKGKGTGAELGRTSGGRGTDQRLPGGFPAVKREQALSMLENPSPTTWPGCEPRGGGPQSTHLSPAAPVVKEVLEAIPQDAERDTRDACGPRRRLRRSGTLRGRPAARRGSHGEKTRQARCPPSETAWKPVALTDAIHDRGI